MRLKLLFLSLMLGGCMGCQQGDSEDYFVYQDFSETFYCNSLEIPLDTALFRYPFRIKIKEGRAIILDLHNPDFYYHLFSYPDFKYFSSFGRRGSGPQEVLSGESVIFLHADSIYTLDANKSEIQCWGVEPKVDIVMRLQETVKLESEILRALDFALVNDSTFVIPDYSGMNRFCLVNRQGKIKSRHGRIPSGDISWSNASRPALAQAWRSFISYNPRNDVLAMVTQLGEVLEIYHLRDSNYHSVSIGPHGMPDFEIFKGHAIPAGIMGFSDVSVTEHYIYAVFHGQSFKDIRTRGSIILDGGKYVYVFDLNGVPVCKYELDRNVYAIYVDESQGEFIMLDVNNDQPLVKCILPDKNHLKMRNK